MTIHDLRSHLVKLDAAGKLTKIKGADLKYVVGTITDINSAKAGNSILFDEFEGYDPGFRVMVGSLNNTATVAAALGLEGTYTKLELADELSKIIDVLDEKQKNFPAIEVETGPIFENSFQGNDVDLYKIPVPTWHEKDGGPYIGTGGYQIHVDPDNGWINAGTYRVMQHDKNRIGNYISPGHHGNIIRAKYWDRGEGCPVAFVMGGHPLMLLLASSDVPMNVNEYNWAGAFTGEAIQVVKTSITGLPVPAHAEIVLEGYAYPTDKCLEGPFGEFTGYYGGGVREEYFVKIEGMYFRNDPILLGSPPGPVPNDTTFYFSLMRSAGIKSALIRAGVPGIKGVWVPEAGDGRAIVVTSIEQKYAGHASMVAHIAGQCPQGALLNAWSIVVDDDIDPSDNDQVIWALGTRVEPIDDVDIVKDNWSNPLSTMITREDKALGKFSTSKGIIRATMPYDRLKRGVFAPSVRNSPELVASVKEQYGFIWGE